MIPLPLANAISRPYRGLSVQETDLPLEGEAAVLDHLQGREVYRRTEWLVLRNGPASALVAVRKASEDPLFSPVVEARVLALPSRMRRMVSPETDVGNASALAAAVAPDMIDEVDAYAVQGTPSWTRCWTRGTPSARSTGSSTQWWGGGREERRRADAAPRGARRAAHAAAARAEPIRGARGRGVAQARRPERHWVGGKQGSGPRVPARRGRRAGM